MTAASLPILPAPAVIDATLRNITEALARDLAGPAATAPPWSAFEWRAARAAAAMHGVSGLLAGKQLWRGPDDWHAFLNGQRDHIAQRHARIEALLCELEERLLSRQIAAVALKGASLFALGLYAPGERPMADIDLLVAPAALETAAGAIEGLGFTESLRTVKHRVFVPRIRATPAVMGEHAGNDMKIELHEQICEPLPVRPAALGLPVLGADARPGLNPYASTGSLMGHLLLHAAGNMVCRSLRLVQLHDIALLCPRLSPADWDLLLSSEGGSAPWWSHPPLALVARYFEGVPGQALARSARSCPWVLRRLSSRQLLSDVSLSRVWVEAFPGIEWSRSLVAALGYARTRIVPSASTLNERRSALHSEPALSEGDWAGLSQTRRIVRYLTSRPARPWPLHNVRTALEQRHEPSEPENTAAS
jgi:hypothetical protein